MIYLDYAATGPVREEVIEEMLRYMGPQAHYANVSSDHAPGRQAAKTLEQARERFAALVGAQAADIVWTGGATEANNLAVLGAARFYQGRGKRLSVSKIEHKSVVDAARHLSTQSFQLDWLMPQASGEITQEDFEASLQDDTVLASCMLVNNETGVIQNIPAFAAACEDKQVLLHSDMVQALGKVPIQLRRWKLAMASFSAHKLGGPKGVGALYLRSKPKVSVQPLVFGGGQERGLRSGTVATHQIMGFVKAAELAVAEQQAQHQRLSQMRQMLWDKLEQNLSGLIYNAETAPRTAHILNISIAGVDGEALRADLDQLAVSSGSACTSDHAEPSYVLRALGRDDALADASLRMSLGAQSQEKDVQQAADMIIASVRRLRALSPDWEEAA